MSLPTCSIEGCEKPLFGRGWCNMHYRRWWKHGSPFVTLRERRHEGGCQVDGCDRPHDSKGYCGMHSQRVRRYGDPHHLEGPSDLRGAFGESHPSWRGDDITYSAAHDRVEKQRGKAREWMCAFCAVPAEGWAYTHDDPEEKVSPEGWPYSLDSDRYIPLCQSCHKELDWAYRKEEAKCSPL